MSDRRSSTVATVDAFGSRRTTSALTGIVLIVTGVFVFSTYSALGKWLAAVYSPWQIMFFRGLFGFIPFVIYPLVRRRYGMLRSQQPLLQLVRGVLGFGANLFFIFAYREMPLADAVAIGYAAPVFVVVLSVPLLSERVGIRRASAALVGFAGVVLIAQPGAGLFSPGALYALAGTLCYSLLVIATRRLGLSDSALSTALYSNCVYALACSLALPHVWTTPGVGDLGFLVTTGLLGGTGMLLFAQAYRHAEASVLAPFDYTAMLWAIGFGFVIWGELPGAVAVVGMVVIAGSGLFLTAHERLRRFRPVKP